MSKSTTVQSLGKSGFKFSFLQPEKPDARNMLDLLCVALSKMAEPNDPVITEAWRSLERQFQSGMKKGYSDGYIAGLAAGNALVLAAKEVEEISHRSKK